MEEIIHNEISLQEFNPNSLNTIRIVTFTDNNGKCEIISIILRMGIGNSITDNLCNGGIACSVDIRTGELYKYARNEKNQKFSEHPTSNKKFEEFIIPYFEESKELVVKTAEQIPEAQYVGWDVAITQDGPCLIEGNTPPSEETTEFSGIGHWEKLKKILKIK